MARSNSVNSILMRRTIKSSVGCVPGEACDETPRLVERHLGEVVFRRADSLHEAVHENHRSSLRVVEVGVGLDGLGDRLRPLQGLGDALRRLCAADRIASDRRLADLVALRLEPRGEVFVGLDLRFELRFSGDDEPHVGLVEDRPEDLHLLLGVLRDELVRLVDDEEVSLVRVEEVPDAVDPAPDSAVAAGDAEGLLNRLHKIAAAHGVVALNVGDPGELRVLPEGVCLICLNF